LPDHPFIAHRNHKKTQTITQQSVGGGYKPTANEEMCAAPRPSKSGPFLSTQQSDGGELNADAPLANDSGCGIVGVGVVIKQ
jgi:hypothetical protein